MDLLFFHAAMVRLCHLFVASQPEACIAPPASMCLCKHLYGGASARVCTRRATGRLPQAVGEHLQATWAVLASVQRVGLSVTLNQYRFLASVQVSKHSLLP